MSNHSWRVFSGNPYQGIPAPGQPPCDSPSPIESKAGPVRHGLTDAAPFTPDVLISDREVTQIHQATSPRGRIDSASTSRPVDSKLGSAEQDAVLDQIKAACKTQHGTSASSSALIDAIRRAVAIEPFAAHAVLETLMNASMDPTHSPLTANPLHDPGAEERTLAKQFLAGYLEVRGKAAWPDLAAFIEKSARQPDTHQFKIHILSSIIELACERRSFGQLPLVDSLWALAGNAWIQPVAEQWPRNEVHLVDSFCNLVIMQTPSPERLRLVMDQFEKRNELPRLGRALETKWIMAADMKAGVLVAPPSHKDRGLIGAQVAMFFGKAFATGSLDQLGKLAFDYSSVAHLWLGKEENEALLRTLIRRCAQAHPHDQVERHLGYFEIVRSIVDKAHAACPSGSEAVLLDELVAAIGKTGPVNWTNTVGIFLSRSTDAGQWTPDETRNYLSNQVMQEAENLTVTQLSEAIHCIAKSGEKGVGRLQSSGLLQAMEALKNSQWMTWRACHVAAVAQGMVKAIVRTSAQDVQIELAAWLRSELHAFKFASHVLVEVDTALDKEFKHLAPRGLTDSKVAQSSEYEPDVQGRAEQLELLHFDAFDTGEALVKMLNRHAPLESSADIRYGLVKNLLVSHADKMSYLLPPMNEILLRRLMNPIAAEREKSDTVQEMLLMIETFAQQYDIDPLISGQKAGVQRNADRDRSALEALRECGRQMRAVRAPGSAQARTMLVQITRQLKLREDALSARIGVDQKGRRG